MALSEVWGKGGDGGVELAKEVIRLADIGNDNFRYIYDTDLSIQEKIEKIVCEIYCGDGVDFAPAAQKEMKKFQEMGFGNLPVCMAKTQYSVSDDPLKLGAPKGFRVTVRNMKVSAGAGFVVALTGEIMTMPGLPKVPSAEKIDVDSAGLLQVA